MKDATAKAVRWVGCPKCGADPGKPCRTPKYRLSWRTHDARVKLLWKVKELADICKGSDVFTFEGVIKLCQLQEKGKL